MEKMIKVVALLTVVVVVVVVNGCLVVEASTITVPFNPSGDYSTTEIQEFGQGYSETNQMVDTTDAISNPETSRLPGQSDSTSRTVSLESNQSTDSTTRTSSLETNQSPDSTSRITSSLESNQSPDSTSRTSSLETNQSPDFTTGNAGLPTNHSESTTESSSSQTIDFDSTSTAIGNLSSRVLETGSNGPTLEEQETSLRTTLPTLTTKPAAPESGIPIHIWNKLEMKLSVALNISFVEELTSKYTKVYRELEDKVTRMLTEVFAGCPGYLRSSVSNFKKGSVIAEFSVFFDPKSLIYSSDVTINDIKTHLLNASLEIMKSYSDPSVNSTYVETETTREIEEQSKILASYTEHPCDIPRVCANNCYKCIESDPPLCVYFSECNDKQNSICHINEDEEPTCRCQKNHQMSGEECINSNDVLRKWLAAIGGSFFAFGVFVGLVCTVRLTYGKVPSTRKMDPQEKKILKAGVANAGFDLSSEMQHAPSSGLDEGVRLRVNTLQNYATFQNPPPTASPAAASATKQQTPPSHHVITAEIVPHGGEQSKISDDVLSDEFVDVYL